MFLRNIIFHLTLAQSLIKICMHEINTYFICASGTYKKLLLKNKKYPDSLFSPQLSQLFFFFFFFSKMAKKRNIYCFYLKTQLSYFQAKKNVKLSNRHQNTLLCRLLVGCIFTKHLSTTDKCVCGDSDTLWHKPK